MLVIVLVLNIGVVNYWFSMTFITNNWGILTTTEQTMSFILALIVTATVTKRVQSTHGVVSSCVELGYSGNVGTYLVL